MVSDLLAPSLTDARRWSCGCSTSPHPRAEAGGGLVGAHREEHPLVTPRVRTARGWRPDPRVTGLVPEPFGLGLPAGCDDRMPGHVPVSRGLGERDAGFEVDLLAVGAGE